MTLRFQNRFAPAALLLGIAVTILTVVAAAAQGDPVIARVNGVEVRQSDLALAEEDLGQSLPPNAQGEAKREYLIGYIADVILVAKAAEAKKVQDQADFKSRSTYLRNKLLMELQLQAEAKAAVTDQALKAVYEDAIKQMANEFEVRARHILVPTEN